MANPSFDARAPMTRSLSCLPEGPRTQGVGGRAGNPDRAGGGACQTESGARGARPLARRADGEPRLPADDPRLEDPERARDEPVEGEPGGIGVEHESEEE